jgi:hypothetical protein
MVAHAPIERCPRLAQWEDPVDDGSKPATIDQRCKLQKLRPAGLNDKVDRSYPALRCLIGRGLRRYRHEPATTAHDSGRALEARAAGRIEHQIDGINDILETDRGVVDDLFDANRPCRVNVPWRHGSDDVGSRVPSQLRRKGTDTAGNAVNQHPLARREMPMIEQPLPGAERGEGDCSRFRVIERSWLRGEESRRDGDVLRRRSITIERRQREDRVASCDVLDVTRDECNDSRELVRRDCWKPVSRPIEFIARNRCGMNAYERLSMPGLRGLNLLDSDLSAPVNDRARDARIRSVIRAASR